MKFFEYPYVIITILAIIFLAMGVIGLYFTMKSVKTAKGTVEKNFCGIGKIENDFEKTGALGKNRSIIYVSFSLDSMIRLYSESKAIRMYEQIKNILLNHLCISTGGEISLHGKENFVALNDLQSEEIILCIDNCVKEINEIFVSHSAVGVVSVHFGYFCTSSTEVSFKTALERAKQALRIAEYKDILYCQWDSTNGKEFERKLKIENNIQNKYTIDEGSIQ